MPFVNDESLFPIFSAHSIAELQSPTDNGFKKLTKGELKNRFGLTKTQSVAGIKLEQQVVVIEAESLYNNAEFIKLLGYLNTAEGKQMKDADGHAK